MNPDFVEWYDNLGQSLPKGHRAQMRMAFEAGQAQRAEEKDTVAKVTWFLATFLKAIDFHDGHGTPSIARPEAMLLEAEAKRLLYGPETP